MITNNTNIDDFKYDGSVKDIVIKTYSYIIKKNIKVTNDEFQNILDSLIIFKDKNFNRCWINEYLFFWTTLLKDKVDHIQKKKLKYLQIGVFEGLSLLYLTQVILKNFEVEITIIDDFSTEQYFNTEKTFDENLKGINVRKYKQDSNDALIDLIYNKEKFDFIYCCGSRKPYVVFVDMALLTRLTQDGSYVLLDDYTYYSSYENDISPDLVKDIFMKSFRRYCENIALGLQNLLIFKELKPVPYIPKEKKPDCVNRDYKKYRDKYYALKYTN